MDEWENEGVNKYTNGTGNWASLFIGAPQGESGVAAIVSIHFQDRNWLHEA